MNKPWHKTESDSEASEHDIDFWSMHHEEMQSAYFWADRIKKLRSEPANWQALALVAG